MPASEPISEGWRLALLNRLCKILGDEEANTLMESLPAVHWHDLATKDDIKGTHEAIDHLEERLRTEMDAGFAKVDAEFKMLRGENKEFRGEMALQFAKQTRTMVFTMLGLSLPTWGAILAMALG